MQSNAFDAPRRAPATQESPTPTRGPASQADGEADPRGDGATSDLVEALKALASDKRLAVLGWLRDPTAHFPPQRDGERRVGKVQRLLVAFLDRLEDRLDQRREGPLRLMGQHVRGSLRRRHGTGAHWH